MGTMNTEQTEQAEQQAGETELQELRAFRRAVLELAVPQWRSAAHTRNHLLKDLRNLLGACTRCEHPDHLGEQCPTITRGDIPCECGA